MSFGSEMMRQAMIEKKWSQSELARRCGVERTTITKICNNVNTPSIKVARKIGEVLDIDWSMFYTTMDEALEMLKLDEMGVGRGDYQGSCETARNEPPMP